MPCCQSLLSVAASASASASAGGTPSWLHRLHAKEGLSFPSHLHIDDLYAQPPPPPPLPSSNQQLAVVQEPPPKAKHPKPKQQLQHPPRARSNNPSRPNPTSPQPPPLSAVVSDLSPPPSDLPPSSPLKAFRKKPGPRPRAERDDKDKKPRKRRRAADADGERSSRTELTVFDTSIDGWKACKLLVRKGGVWKIRDRKATEVSEPEDLSKGKRRAGLASKLKRNRREKEKEKEKEATLQLQQGNIHATRGVVMEDPGDPVPIQTLKRPTCSEPVSEGQSAGIFLLHSLQVESRRMG